MSGRPGLRTVDAARSVDLRAQGMLWREIALVLRCSAEGARNAAMRLTDPSRYADRLRRAHDRREASKPADWRPGKPGPRPSFRARQAAEMQADGLTCPEIAEMLGATSLHAVRKAISRYRASHA